MTKYYSVFLHVPRYKNNYFYRNKNCFRRNFLRKSANSYSPPIEYRIPVFLSSSFVAPNKRESDHSQSSLIRDTSKTETVKSLFSNTPAVAAPAAVVPAVAVPAVAVPAVVVPAVVFFRLT